MVSKTVKTKSMLLSITKTCVQQTVYFYNTLNVIETLFETVKAIPLGSIKCY